MSHFDFGQLVSSVAQNNFIDHIPGNQVTPPPEQVIDHVAYPGDPSLQFGQAVSEFIHNPVTDFHLL
jgi:hypothetical protein